MRTRIHDLWRDELLYELDLGPERLRDLRCYVMLRSSFSGLTTELVDETGRLARSLLTYGNNTSVLDMVDFVYIMSKAMTSLTAEEIDTWRTDQKARQ